MIKIPKTPNTESPSEASKRLYDDELKEAQDVKKLKETIEQELAKHRKPK